MSVLLSQRAQIVRSVRIVAKQEDSLVILNSPLYIGLLAIGLLFIGLVVLGFTIPILGFIGGRTNRLINSTKQERRNPFVMIAAFLAVASSFVIGFFFVVAQSFLRLIPTGKPRTAV